MKRPLDLGRRYLEVADRDIRTFRLLAAAVGSDDEAVGFHAQQSVEKCIKAVLSVNEIAFRKTHDLAELIDRLRDNQKILPPEVEVLEALNPYAVTLRYDLFDVEPAALNRDRMLKVVADVRSWAEGELALFADRSGPGEEGR
jgi:HEPN domain-containing protein